MDILGNLFDMFGASGYREFYGSQNDYAAAIELLANPATTLADTALAATVEGCSKQSDSDLGGSFADC